MKPRLRWPLELQEVEIKGERFVVVRDQVGVAPEPAVIPESLLPVVARFDGVRTVASIVDEGKGVGLTEEIVNQLVETLDQMYLLDNERSNLRLKTIRQDFANSTIRKPKLAPGIYPTDPVELRKAIEGFAKNSIKLDSETKSSLNADCCVQALVSPHIDYRRGSKTYGVIARAFEQIERPDLVVLMGTAHQPGTGGRFHFCTKDFETPLGTFKAAKDEISKILEHYGESRGLRDEILHQHEHSLELQLPFLAYRYEKVGLPAIIPILVGSFHANVVSGASPTESEDFRSLQKGLAELIDRAKETKQKLLFICGVDLAHMGGHFGDEDKLGSEDLLEIEQKDRALIDKVCNGDSQGMFEHICLDKDTRRICGFPTLYTMLAAFDLAGIKVKGRLLEYRQAFDSESDCLVSFCGLSLNVNKGVG